MKRSLQRKWAVALESGKFKQGEGQLEDHDFDIDGREYLTHCCLGVLCRIAGVKADIAARNEQILTNFEKIKFGISQDIQLHLANDMNDRGHSFRRIAKYIRTHDMMTGKKLAKPIE